ncbi:MAG: methionyl-tRNA formyltransferase [Desulfovibrionaceae bacterium]|nr:methionyl-tRNA formyltransferase [Desulfovibrionaceae bacterium]
MKLAFMGTPEFAAASLEALLAFTGVEILAVYCQPDRPAGRGALVSPGPVKRLALEHGLPVRQPENFKDGKIVEELAALGADLFAVAAYGLILPQAALDLPPLGALNVHASLLPELRGAAPIQRAIMAGALRTGVSIMRMERRLDSGPVLLQRAMGIGFEQNAGEVHDELALLGGRLLVETLERLAEGRLREMPQDESRATYASRLSKADGWLDFTRGVRELHNHVRGVTPWPGAQVRLDLAEGSEKGGIVREGLSLLVQKGRPLEGEADKKAAAASRIGEFLPLREDVLPVVCRDGLYGLERMKPAGGRSLSAVDFVNGYLKGGRWMAAAG